MPIRRENRIWTWVLSHSKTGGAALGLFCLLSLGCTALAETTAILERETITIDQTVRLVIESTDEINATPDYSVLEENFHLIGAASRQSVSIASGIQTTVKQWIIELEPKQPGTYTLGPISVGQHQTQPVELTVLPPNNPAAHHSGEAVFIELSLSPQAPYVQQQLILTVQLFLNVDLVEGSLTAPAPHDTLVEKLGDDIQYTIRRGTASYRVIERRYALFPQRSGTFTIPPVHFQGRAESPAQGNQPLFDSFFRQGKRIQAASEALVLDVRPPADTFSGQHWLPAKKLSVAEISQIPDKHEVGKPVTLQLKLAATGLTATQLPPVDLPTSESYRIYPDKAQPETTFDGTDIQSVVTRRFAIIPTREGEIEIPGIAINWWNTDNDQMETASLPPRLIQVSDPLRHSDTSRLPPTPLHSQPITSHDPVSVSSTEPSILHSPPEVPVYWKWLSIGLFALWLVTCWGLFRRKRNNASGIQAPADPTTQKIMRQLEAACKTGNAVLSRQYLLSWIKQKRPAHSPVTLEDISLITSDPVIRIAVSQLDRHLYSRKQAPWDGLALLRALKRHQSPKKPKAESGLPTLFPT